MISLEKQFDEQNEYLMQKWLESQPDRANSVVHRTFRRSLKCHEHQERLSSRRKQVPTNSKMRYQKIGIQRTACFGTCPIYTATISSDGTVEYQGDGYVQQVGYIQSRVASAKFDTVAARIAELGFWEMEYSYSVNITCNPFTYLMVETEREIKVIRVYALGWSGMPAELSEIANLIDSLVEDSIGPIREK